MRKPWYLSRTLWLNALALMVAAAADNVQQLHDALPGGQHQSAADGEGIELRAAVEDPAAEDLVNDAPLTAKQRRLIYGRGFHDGEAAAHRQYGDFMREQVWKEKVAALTGMARKVYEVFTDESPLKLHNVQQRLKDKGITNSGHEVRGALAHLRERGLVIESHDEFRRVPLPAAKPRAAEEAPQPPLAVSKTVASASSEAAPPSFDRLAALASSLRARSAELSAIADQLDDVALQSAQELQSVRDRHERLEQLAAILKTI